MCFYLLKITYIMELMYILSLHQLLKANTSKELLIIVHSGIQRGLFSAS
ncbi:hypothetical protein SK3146_01814 [Paenibacillus konkukensis]|uniref:Uncharacterized protein n=1 Tax=Paenibacillus konkukensis TaxID=2020716 RepID=A0ABY4RKV9_9BACL|nr:hypothetical protein SK3146_01814 [Paenibacillus konkukensis]